MSEMHRASESGPTEADAITWLHLSDIHIDRSNVRDQERCLAALIRDIETACMQPGAERVAPPPQLLIVSGDIAARGDFELAESWIGRVQKACGIGPDSTFVIPGNHDIDRAAVPDDAEEALNLDHLGRDGFRHAVDTLWNSDRLLALGEKFESYRDFAERYAAVTLSALGTWWHRVVVNGVDVQLLGLNSVWTGGSRTLDRAGIPAVGRVQRELLGALMESTPGKPDISFVLQHNPTSYLNPVDGLEHASWLDELDAVVLCGHLHDSEMAERRSVRGRHLEILGGALYPGYEDARRYSIGTVQMRPSERRFSIALRAADSDSDFFARDVRRYRSAPDGLIEAGQGFGATNLGQPIDAMSVPRDELDVVLEHAFLRYDAGKFRVTIIKHYTNNTSRAWTHLYVRVWVNAHPDDAEAARDLYERHRLDLRAVRFYARCEGDPLDWEVEHDHESSKEILLKVGARNDGAGIAPGETVVVEHGFEVDDAFWGPYFECNVRLRTEHLHMQLDFPRNELERAWLVANPHVDGGKVLEDMVSLRQIGDRDIYEAVLDHPPKQNRYRLCWRPANRDRAVQPEELGSAG